MGSNGLLCLLCAEAGVVPAENKPSVRRGFETGKTGGKPNEVFGSVLSAASRFGEAMVRFREFLRRDLVRRHKKIQEDLLTPEMQ